MFFLCPVNQGGYLIVKTETLARNRSCSERETERHEENVKREGFIKINAHWKQITET